MASNNASLVTMWNQGGLSFGFAPGKNCQLKGLVSCEVTEGDELPRLHMVFHRQHFIYFSSREIAEKSGVEGFLELCEKDSTSNHVWEKDETHIWVCNFRRYGWSWTYDQKGEYGYSGQCWLNGDCVVGADTPNDVIRMAFMANWKEAMKKSGAGFDLSAYTPEVTFPALRLLKEGLNNEGSIKTATRALAGVNRALAEKAAELNLVLP